MKKHLFLISIAAYALLSCGSNEPTESTENTTNVASNEDWTWGNITKESIAGKWTVDKFDSEIYDSGKLTGKSFDFNGDTLNWSYFMFDNNIETKSCFYEVTEEGAIKITVPMGNGDKWITFEAALDNEGILRLDHKGNMVWLKKAQ